MTQHLMTAAMAVRLLDALERHGDQPWVGGGWAVDALFGEQTRPHADLDLWLPAVDLEPAIVALSGFGVDRVLAWGGDRPWNFVLHDGGRLRVDLHLYEPLPNGAVHYGSVLDGPVFPASALQAEGLIDKSAVRCEAPDWHCAGTPATRRAPSTVTTCDSSARGSGSNSRMRIAARCSRTRGQHAVRQGRPSLSG